MRGYFVKIIRGAAGGVLFALALCVPAARLAAQSDIESVRARGTLLFNLVLDLNLEAEKSVPLKSGKALKEQSLALYDSSDKLCGLYASGGLNVPEKAADKMKQLCAKSAHAGEAAGKKAKGVEPQIKKGDSKAFFALAIEIRNLSGDIVTILHPDRMAEQRKYYPPL